MVVYEYNARRRQIKMVIQFDATARNNPRRCQVHKWLRENRFILCQHKQNTRKLNDMDRKIRFKLVCPIFVFSIRKLHTNNGNFLYAETPNAFGNFVVLRSCKFVYLKWSVDGHVFNYTNMTKSIPKWYSHLCNRKRTRTILQWNLGAQLERKIHTVRTNTSDLAPFTIPLWSMLYFYCNINLANDRDDPHTTSLINK